MCKQQKTFHFTYEFVKPITKNGRIASEKLSCTVEAIAYRRVFDFDPGMPEYSVDIVIISWLDKDITRIVYFFDLADEVEVAALAKAADQFEETCGGEELKEKLRYIASVLTQVKGYSILSLLVPIMVRLNDILPPVQIDGLSVSASGQVCVHDLSGRAYPVEAGDMNASKIINAIEERLVKTFGRMTRLKIA